MVELKKDIIHTGTCVASFQKFVLTRKYFLQKAIKHRVVTFQLCSRIDVVVYSVWRILFVVAVEVTLSPFCEILSVG